MGFWAFYFVDDQVATTSYVGGWVGGVFLWVCFCKQLVLQWAEFFTKIGGFKSYSISKNEIRVNDYKVQN